MIPPGRTSLLNSIEMMESGRWGRRKQKNPQRKNVENGDTEVGGPDQPVDRSETEEQGLTDDESSSEHATDDSVNEPGSCHDSSTNHDNDSREQNKLCSQDTNVETVVTENNQGNGICDQGDRNWNQENDAGIQGTSSSGNLDNSDVSKEAPVSKESVVLQVPAICPPSLNKDLLDAEKENISQDTENQTPAEIKKRSTTEEEKIKEYLCRDDTAVIYPEPVSDGEEKCTDQDVGTLLEEDIVLHCIHCDQTFLRANILRDHMREHHADKPLKFLCPKCDETFHQKSQLDKHLALHSPTSQICRVCNKTFANVYRLQRHMISHDESNDLRKFKCPECGKAFKFKHHLKEHIRIHSGEKPFECPNCGKRFSHSGSYSSHMTSKKCWVVSAHKSRGRTDGEDSYSSPTKTPYSSNKLHFPRLNHSLPTSQGSIHPPSFLPFPRKPGIPAYYSPPMYDAQRFIPCAVYSMNQSLLHHPLIPNARFEPPSAEIIRKLEKISSQATQGSQISPNSQGTQISPDVNSNTKLLVNHSLSAEVEESAKDLTSYRDKPVSQPEATCIQKVVNCHCDEATEVKDKSENNVKTEETEDMKEELKTDSDIKSENVNLPCRFCGEVFRSPVDQHQHERYICKNNKDVVVRMAQIAKLDTSCQSPCSPGSDISHRDTPNGSASTGTDDEEVEELYKDVDSSFEKKIRMRSLFTEEQLLILKAHYQVNPRPRKFELIRIGNTIGFPKRVVQVWFQNMRARDRKQGRDIPVSLPTIDRPESRERELTKSPTYIPNVPKPFPNKYTLSSPGHSSQSSTKSVTPPVSDHPRGEKPLDLTMRRTPPEAHGGSVSRLSTPDHALDEQVLNLSMKKSPTEAKPAPSHSSFRDSAIFKYMQQEGMFFNKGLFPVSSAMTHGLVNMLQSQGIPHSMSSLINVPSCINSNINSELNGLKHNQNLRNDKNYGMKRDSSGSVKSEDHERGQLVIDEDQDSSCDASMSSPRGPTLVTPAMKKLFQSGDMEEDTHNLATLAEAAAEAASFLAGKSKRIRKKTWRQMEAEEAQLDLEDSLSCDEDHPLRKKRKSWKNHRVDRDEGLYACDQCNKMFNKQSSLARHKYEHSGARPFSCDMCTKAFKHKHHLTEHKRLHSGEKPFQCKKCGKRFSHSGSYSQHMNHRYNYCTPNKGDDNDGDNELSS